jgi:hypothetical protein
MRSFFWDIPQIRIFSWGHQAFRNSFRDVLTSDAAIQVVSRKSHENVTVLYILHFVSFESLEVSISASYSFYIYLRFCVKFKYSTFPAVLFLFQSSKNVDESGYGTDGSS